MVCLIPNWKRAWKFASVQLPVLGLILMSVSDFVQQSWASLPPQFQKDIPHATTIAMIMFALSLVGRLVTLTQKDNADADSK